MYIIPRLGLQTASCTRLQNASYSETHSKSVDLFFARFSSTLLYAEYERITLNAVEERILPPDVRIKIAVAQANAGDYGQEKMEADVREFAWAIVFCSFFVTICLSVRQVPFQYHARDRNSVCQQDAVASVGQRFVDRGRCVSV